MRMGMLIWIVGLFVSELISWAPCGEVVMDWGGEKVWESELN